MLENDPVVFAAAGSVPILESDHVNGLAESRNVRRPAVYKRSGTGGKAVRITSPLDGYGSGESKPGRLNRCDYRHH